MRHWDIKYVVQKHVHLRKITIPHDNSISVHCHILCSILANLLSLGLLIIHYAGFWTSCWTWQDAGPAEQTTVISVSCLCYCWRRWVRSQVRGQEVAERCKGRQTTMSLIGQFFFVMIRLKASQLQIIYINPCVKY